MAAEARTVPASHTAQRHADPAAVPAREVAAGHAVWVNGRWRAALSGASETAPGLVTIALSGIGLMHLPARHLLTITTT